MEVTKVKAYIVRCEYCYAGCALESTESLAKLRASERGWTMIGAKNACPNCAPRIINIINSAIRQAQNK